MKRKRIDLLQDDIPRYWYNILPDLPERLPPYIEFENGKNIEYLPETFTQTASKLEFSKKRRIDIPEDVLNEYIHSGRPCPLIRAYRLEEFLKTSAKIYYKCEDLMPGGTFKMNASIPQAYWAMKEGYKRIVFGSGMSTRTKFLHISAIKAFGLTPTIFMSRTQCRNFPNQVFFLKKMFGVDLVESPSNRTAVGRNLLDKNPEHSGSSLIVKKEVEKEITQNKDAITIVSSKFNHILMAQTIIGLEVEKQLELIDEKPDILIAAAGGGSNFHGLIAPFMRDFLKKRLRGIKFIAVESETSSKLTNGEYKYVPLQVFPLLGLLGKTYEFNWKTSPPPIIGSGLQSKDTAPITSLLRNLGLVDTRVYPKDELEILEAAKIFLQTEGRLVAPESAYSVRATIDEALKTKKTKEEKVIVTSLSGTTYLDFGEKQKYVNLIEKR